MHILVLDTIHGGSVLGDALRRMGHHVDLVDVYRGDCTGEGTITPDMALAREYDLLVHPVHLDPAYSLLRRISCPAVTHHEVVRWIIRKRKEQGSGGPGPVIEVTGTRGKTTTATALASILPGSGILHTSRGICRYPGGDMLDRMSITPASLLTAMSYIRPGEWFVGEVSLGFTGIGDLAILTSEEDYPVGANRMSAREIKRHSSMKCSHLLVPPGIHIPHDHADNAADIASCSGTACSYRYREMDGTIENTLISLEGYRVAFQLAAAACLLLGFRPDGLCHFESLPGRLQVIVTDGKIIIDNACSGAGLRTTGDAVSLLIRTCGSIPYTLIIGQEERAVCENFPTSDIIAAVREGKPAELVLVAGDERISSKEIIKVCIEESIPVHVAVSLDRAMDIARTLKPPAIVTSVKTWR